MTNDDMMTKWGLKRTKLSILIFQSPSIKPSLEICVVISKEGIVTLRGTGLAVPSCKGPSTMVMNPTYAVLSRNKLCRESRAHEGGRGVAKK